MAKAALKNREIDKGEALDDAEGSVAALGEASVLSLVDVAIHDTVPDDIGTYGVGLHVADGAEATVSRALIAGCADVVIATVRPTVGSSLQSSKPLQ